MLIEPRPKTQVTQHSCLSIILAAGEGTRMRSRLPKVLHAIAGLPLLAHVLSSVAAAGTDAAAVVIGPNHGAVADEAVRRFPSAEVFVQHERQGTAHAVLAARPALERRYGEVLVLFADTPLVRPETLLRLRASLREGAAVAVLGFQAADPTGYGRLLTDGGRLLAIREHKDASPSERAVHFCNAGIMALRGDAALPILEQIGNTNAQNEFYLTDAVAVANAMGLPAIALQTDEDEVRGVNSRAQLAEAEAVLQRRLRAAAMEGGATLVAPETVFLSADTKLGRDVVLEPNVVFGPGVVVEDEAVIHAFSHLEGAHIGRGASVGPFARLRPGTELGAKVRIGNFVETKAAAIESGAKVNHLSYVGDARVGTEANVGAGTITCNYDGEAKHRTDIGRGAFIGSNSALVAPVTIGEGAYVGSGSVITQNVPAGSLAVGRARQVTKEGWAERMREARELARAKRKEATAP